MILAEVSKLPTTRMMRAEAMRYLLGFGGPGILDDVDGVRLRYENYTDDEAIHPGVCIVYRADTGECVAWTLPGWCEEDGPIAVPRVDQICCCGRLNCLVRDHGALVPLRTVRP